MFVLIHPSPPPLTQMKSDSPSDIHFNALRKCSSEQELLIYFPRKVLTRQLLGLGDEVGQEIIIHRPRCSVSVDALIPVVVTAAPVAAARVPVEVAPLPLVVPLHRMLAANGIAPGQGSPPANGSRVAVGHLDA